MHDVKRIEIIASFFERGKITDALEQSGVHAHAVIPNVSGKQLHAGKEDLDTIMTENVYIVAFCTPEILQPVVESIRPLLNRLGGTCHITDALEIECDEQ